MLYVLARSLGGGRAEGVASSLGTFAGGMFHVLAAAVGVSAVLASSAAAFSAVKWAGAAYLMYLGLRALLAEDDPPQPPEPPSGGTAADARGWAGAFHQGAVTEALNPKTALFFLAFVPQFVDPTAGSPFLQFAILGCLSVALNSCADIVVALLAGPLGQRLKESPRLRLGQRTVTGGALVSLGVYAALSGGRS
jgi:threonine/homoserine/homoserine lactone efflux protein